ncbi:hypothetical protein, partial [Rhizobium brockwellii]|uniref:hypothetical protein n=1 Tax=Rhizobium brockwellii TaxID=3019932 RepID=UPI003F9B0708
MKRKPKTYVEYKLAVERYIKPVLGSTKFALVIPSDVSRMQAHIVQRHKTSCSYVGEKRRKNNRLG